jgi:hypothetical protein
MSNFESYHNEFHVIGEPDIRDYICKKTGNEAATNGGASGDREAEAWAENLRKQAANNQEGENAKND